MISLEKVCFQYEQKRAAIKNLDLQINDHEYLAVMGRNGSGKSALAQLLNGLLVPDAGKVLVDGYDTSCKQDLKEIRSRVGLLFPQPDHQIISNLVEEDVAFGPENLGIPANEIKTRVDTALKMVSMEEFRKHPPYLLSWGQKQKVAIAGILAMNPRYMVLDEPTSMLDAYSAGSFMQVIAHIRTESCPAVILITHKIEEALQADRMIIMEQGEMVFQGAPSQLLGENEFLRQLGIDPLPISLMIEKLNQDGVRPIPGSITDINELINWL